MLVDDARQRRVFALALSAEKGLELPPPEALGGATAVTLLRDLVSQLNNGNGVKRLEDVPATSMDGEEASAGDSRAFERLASSVAALSAQMKSQNERLDKQHMLLRELMARLK